MLRYILLDKRFLILLFIVNLLGTIYGFTWYESQLSVTPPIFIPFVPDSPTASLFFTIFLLFFIFGRNVPYIEALGLVTLFKYGIWAVVMNLLTLAVEGSLDWSGYMLIASHGAMAIQGILYAPWYKIKMRHLVVAAVWTLHNDVIDYVFGMMPIYSSLTDYMNEIGYFTFWLSIISIFIAYKITIGSTRQIV
ncbi:lipoprotein heptaprenylglyceryl N-acetyltransferase LhaT [Virgibacillus kimchii]